MVRGVAVALAIGCGAVGSAQAQRPVAAHERKSSIVYVNREYGFRFRLPRGWAGYSIRAERVEIGESKGHYESIKIRHPRWTEQEPREDIPIWVFTRAQWPSIEDETLIVSAAPFGPLELGRNKRYVFALPPRYSNDEFTGVEEVRKIFTGKPLQGFD
jgi:hypothetical protein